MSRCIYQVAYVYTISSPMVQITVTYWSPTLINHNRCDYSLSLGWSGSDFQNAFFNIVFLVTSDPPLIVPSGVIAAPQIICLISFCTGMHHEYFFRSPMWFRVPHLCSKIPKINNWTGEFATVIWRLHCFTVSFGGDVRGESGPR